MNFNRFYTRFYPPDKRSLSEDVNGDSIELLWRCKSTTLTFSQWRTKDFTTEGLRGGGRMGNFPKAGWARGYTGYRSQPPYCDPGAKSR